MKTRFLSLFTLFIFSGWVQAAKSPIYSHWYKGAIKGADVVAFYDIEPGAQAVQGSDKYTYEWRGLTWKFSSTENRERFKQSPESFVPQYGGYCAFSIAKNFVIAPRVNNWKIVDGKLYLNNNKNSFEIWQVKQDKMIKAADANWPAVLGK